MGGSPVSVKAFVLLVPVMTGKNNVHIAPTMTYMPVPVGDVVMPVAVNVNCPVWNAGLLGGIKHTASSV